MATRAAIKSPTMPPRPLSSSQRAGAGNMAKNPGTASSRESPIDRSQPRPQRQARASDPDSERGKRQDQNRGRQAETLHEPIGDACSPAAKPIMRLRQSRVAGARIPVRPADQGEPAGDRYANERSAQQPPRQTAQFNRERLRQKPCPPRLHPRTPPHS